ncbi:hypothetical protein P7J55_11145, partial [Streptococcus suis]
LPIIQENSYFFYKGRSNWRLFQWAPKKRGYSPRDVIIGQAIGGRNGAMFALLYEADKTHYHCQFCGHNFAIKENRFIRES